MLFPDNDRRQARALYLRDTARDRVGHRVVCRTRCGVVSKLAGRVGLRTRQGRPSNRVKPDPRVMPPAENLAPLRFPDDRKPRPDDPVPAILAGSTAAWAPEDKRRCP